MTGRNLFAVGLRSKKQIFFSILRASVADPDPGSNAFLPPGSVIQDALSFLTLKTSS
jgi:hypothetical protein